MRRERVSKHFDETHHAELARARRSARRPALAMRAPPTPIRLSSGRMRRSAPATPAACRSPDASPATNRTSRTHGARSSTGDAGSVRSISLTI